MPGILLRVARSERISLALFFIISYKFRRSQEWRGPTRLGHMRGLDARSWEMIKGCVTGERQREYLHLLVTTATYILIFVDVLLRGELSNG